MSLEGRLKTKYSYSAANLFPYDSHHEIVMPFGHDLSKLSYQEFKDFISLPTAWFNKVVEKSSSSSYTYPCLMWDFLLRGGASQIHPHGKK